MSTDKQKFTSVWDTIEDTPQEAASMKTLKNFKRELLADPADRA